jgi:hypothetical protein
VLFCLVVDWQLHLAQVAEGNEGGADHSLVDFLGETTFEIAKVPFSKH